MISKLTFSKYYYYYYLLIFMCVSVTYLVSGSARSTSGVGKLVKHIDPGSQDKVVFMESVYFMGKKCQADFVVSVEINIRVVILTFGDIRYLIDKSNCPFKIFKFKFPDKFSFSNRPAGCFIQKMACLAFS